MTKKELSNQMRQRQINKGYVSKEIIDQLTDDNIIDAYITCSECQTKMVDIKMLKTIISKAKDFDHFWDLVQIHSTHK
jgi:23S rRNA-/tRNA-specific pseudouridylate synthase